MAIDAALQIQIRTSDWGILPQSSRRSIPEQFSTRNPPTLALALWLESALKAAGIPTKAYGERDSNHDLGKPDDPATQEFYDFLDPLVGRKP